MYDQKNRFVREYEVDEQTVKVLNNEPKSFWRVEIDFENNNWRLVKKVSWRDW